ncbi:uncharacterized protein LOC133516488 [Cydia pomonella]|uniref:uncharacterized protein LOC133516488 n=1 Tax=Cydia pomonella TaxID=82600 RepID=UPI002ADDC22B|nr:uncharacterized protein LOC133516488 [Cydia pomonella]XP_061705454.1 uncharacterized protein LOC133516488 [Cydia pomonella]
MIKFQGKNLCERHKELNLKVNQAAKSDVDFRVLKTIKEDSDVDRLFKIDLASKCRNIDFIIDQLRCGDSLYITRALKCDWMYDNEYVHIFNPNYLHEKIFSVMSVKMKHKTLTAISMHVRDESRAELFYEYCTNQNFTKHAYKFLMFTSESFKQKFLSDKENFKNVECEHFISLIGNSFLLADTYGKMGGHIKNISYLYSINEDKYLDLYEKYTTPQNYMEHVQVGAKISRSILKKHKNRILKDPPLYLSLLKTSEVVKYSSPEDAQVYATALLPKNVKEFWKINFYVTYKYILDLIKTDLYKFIKKIFTNKYPSEEFEMSKEFFLFGYYDLLNEDDKEIWALLHLEKQLGIIPEYEYYRWFEFVSFSKTFEVIKKRIYVALDWAKKLELLHFLVKSAKTHKEISKVLIYYFETHTNEKKERTQCFLEYVVEQHNVLDFPDACWSVFDKLLNSIELYVSFCKHNILLDISILYHIITNQPFQHFDLSDYLSGTFYYCFEMLPCNNKLSKERKEQVYDYMFKFYMNKIALYETQDYNETLKVEIRPYLKNLASLKYYFENKDDYPSLVMKFMKLDLENFEHNLGIKDLVFTEGYLIRCLKKDPKMIIDQFNLIQKNIKWEGKTIASTFYDKMKIYFSEDLAKQYLNLCIKTLNNISREYPWPEKKKFVFVNVYAIFKLGDELIKSDIMEKHQPLGPKIGWRTDCYQHFVRMGICAFQGYSRPPMPFSKTRPYIRGEYLRHSQGIINMYLMQLTPDSLAAFIRLLLISPLSIQKVGLRLAFHVSKTSGKTNLVITVWLNTKYVSVRKNLYKLVLERIGKKIKQRQETFYVLLKLTSNVKNGDNDEIFKYFKGNKLPECLRGTYLQTAWKAVSALPESNQNDKRKILVINAMISNIRLLDEVFVEALINDFLQKIWNKSKQSPGKICLANDKLANATWRFITEYILDIPNDAKESKTMKIVENIITECFHHWNEKHDGEFQFQLFFKDFVNKLDENASSTKTQYSRVTHIFEYMLKSFEERFGITEMYSYFWDCQLLLLTRIAIDGREQCDRDVHIRFGLEVGKFVKKLKENNCYYVSFLRKIVAKISKCMEMLCSLKSPPLTDRYVKILVAYGLTIYGMYETNVLALEILPDDLSDGPINEAELQQVIMRIKIQNNEELNALMNDKFVYSNLKTSRMT